MALTATLVTSRGTPLGDPPELIEEGTAMRGRKNWWINTTDETEAMLSGVIEPYGTPWSGQFPTLTIVRRRFSFLAGVSSASTGEGGIVRCEVDYETPGGRNGGVPTPEDGLKYTMYRTESASQTVHYDARIQGNAAPGGPFTQPINNAEGAQVEVSTFVAEVVCYYQPQQAPLLGRFFGVKDCINSDAFTLPPWYRTGISYSLNPLEARYRGFEANVVANLIEIRHHILMAPVIVQGGGNLSPHDLFWELEDDKGFAIASEYSQLYRRAPFAHLFD